MMRTSNWNKGALLYLRRMLAAFLYLRRAPTALLYFRRAPAALLCALCMIFICVNDALGAPVKLRNSDAMEILRSGVTDTIINIGNVQYDQGGAHLSCDSSIWIVNKQLLMWGNVTYQDGSRRLLCDTLIYDLVDSIMYATGQVTLEEDQSEIQGDSLKYVVADSTLYVTGDSVIIISSADSMRAVGKEAFVDRTLQRLELYTDARVDFGYPDTLVTRSLTALYIRYEYTSGTAVAQKNVEIIDGDSRATGACAIIERNPPRVRLYDEATLDWLGNFVSGEFIAIHSSSGKPEHIDVYGEAVALFIEEDSSLQSEVGGQRGAEIKTVIEDSVGFRLDLAAQKMLDRETDSVDVNDSIFQPIIVPDKETNADSLEEAVDESSMPGMPVSDTALVVEIEDIASTQVGGKVTSEIRGAHLSFSFVEGLLNRVDAFGQAYSFYTPSAAPGGSEIVNSASGDSIQLYVENNLLHTVKAYGSVVGDYIEDRSARSVALDSDGAPLVDTIHYSGERITFELTDSVITLAGVADVIQGPMSLRADSIVYQTGGRFVRAYAIRPTAFPEASDSAEAPEEVSDTTLDVIPDTLSIDGQFHVDTSGAGLAAVEPYLGTVTLRDGSQDVDGAYVEFSMATRKGLIIQSKSNYEEAYYTGGELFREKEKVFFVDGGTYTTCEYDSPHFHFWSKHMKMIRGEKLIAKPVVFFIEKIPIFVLPYYVFPLQQGRRSGILNFRFGNFNRGGRFLANLGYYWAASEYWDIQGWMDYYETSGPAFSTQMRYNKRYSYSGNFGASVAYTSSFDFNQRETKAKRWRVNFNHRQTVSPTLNVNASGSFLSDSRYFTDFTDNLDDRLNRTLRSQVNFTKRFGRSSMSGSYVFDESLDGDKRKTETFPNLSFSMPAVQIFGSAAPGEERSWYHTIRLGYSSNLRHFSEGRNLDSTSVALADTTVTIDSTFVTIFDITVTPPDSIGVDTTIDTSTSIAVLAIDTTTTRTNRAFTTYRHGTSVGPNFMILGYFPVSFSVRYNETWFKVDATDQSSDAGVRTNRFFRTYTTSASASISTHLYGTVSPNLFGLRGIRHEIVPSATYGYTPNITFDRETRDAASFVGVNSATNQSQSISFGLRNVFDIKVGSGESPKKLTLLTLNSSVSYDPDASERRWSALNTNFQSSIIRRVTMSGNMVHTFYADGGLQSFSINTSFGANGNFGAFPDFYPGQLNPPTAPAIGAIGAIGARVGASPLNETPLGVSGGKSRTWRFNMRHTYSKFNKGASKRNFVSFNASLQLTPNMSVSYSQSYDIENKNTVNRHLRIYRILHQWEGVFDWTPSGSNRGFSFRLNVIALPDIKFEKSLTSSFGRRLLTP